MARTDSPTDNVRATAARTLDLVIRQRRSLSDVLPQQLAAHAPADRPLLQELAFGTLRWFHQLDARLQQLLQKPLRSKEGVVRALLLCGLYQCLHARTPSHAAVSETVAAARVLGRPWAPGLVNAVLRRALREQDDQAVVADHDPVVRWSHPRWLLDRLRADWPDHWQAIAEANNARPPMTLRVNRRQSGRDDYLAALAGAGIAADAHEHAEDAVVLQRPVPVEQLPGFEEGRVSVQDAAGQLAADLLTPEPGDRVLDLCAAPGSKTCHILERYPDIAGLTAVDADAGRLDRLRENLQRLQLDAELVAADGSDPEAWWDGRQYQRILLDAPCSATGVIRRHPDIKLLRRESDIEPLQSLQLALLKAVWPLLAPGGMLVYATCSALRAENELVVDRFMHDHDAVNPARIAARWGLARPIGRQIPAGEADMDGFYYACLRKERVL